MFLTPATLAPLDPYLAPRAYLATKTLVDPNKGVEETEEGSEEREG